MASENRGGRRRQAKSKTGDTEYVSAESRKRRTRHVIWDLEAQVEELEKAIQGQEQEHQQLTRKLAFMQNLVAVREDQAERLKRYGVADKASMPPVLPLELADCLTGSAWRSGSMDMPMLDSQASGGGDTSSSAGARATASYSSGAGESGVHALAMQHPSPMSLLQPPQQENPFVATNHGLSRMHFNKSNADQQLHPGTRPSVSAISVRQPQDFVQMLGAVCDATRRLHLPKIEQVIESDVVLWSEAQILELYKQLSNTLSMLLYTADDRSNPGSEMAANQVLEVVDKMRHLGSIGKICNPIMPTLVSKPVSPGIEPPTDDHWESVVSALRLTEDQVQEILLLNNIRVRCIERMQRDHAAVTSTLSDTHTDLAGHWKFSLNEDLLRKGEMMLKLHRMINSNRWLVVLVDEVVTVHILDSMQFARMNVHSFPYFPDASALVEAVVRIAKRRGTPMSSGMAGTSGARS